MAAKASHTTIPNEADVRRLASFDAGDCAVISFFLDVDGKRFVNRADYETAGRELLRGVDLSAWPRAARMGAEQDLNHIREFLSMELDRAGVRGLAIFACEPRKLWTVYTLPTPMRNRLVLDHHPHVVRLEAVMAHAERYATVLVSRDKARVFFTRFGETIERTEVLDEVPGRHAQGGWSQANYQRHIDELAARHFRHVGEVLFDWFRREPFDHLILAGADESVTTFEKGLHSSITEKVMGRVSLPMNASINRVGEVTHGIEELMNAEYAAESVTRILEEFAAGRHGVVGVEQVLQALFDGRVDILAVGADATRAGYRCTNCGRLAVEDAGCPACEGPMIAVPDLHEEMVDEALRRRCSVVPAETRPLPDGVGALLRF